RATGRVRDGRADRYETSLSSSQGRVAETHMGGVQALMHIELTEMLRCPESHREEMLVLSTGELKDRMIRSGLVGCPVCHKEYPISRGIVNFRRNKERISKESSGPRPAYVPPSPL